MKKIIKGLLVTGGVAAVAVAGLYAWGKHVEKREKKNSDEEFDLLDDEFEIKTDKDRNYVELNPSVNNKEEKQTVEIKTPVNKDNLDEFA